ncbi:mannosyltransferase family protein [Paenibacillus sp. NPDC056579]|uniref:mannosyltransferase family protein n=1 Tax=Paenibacillus sp. NPDC056579 TaxID=3345871 RepID=UPI0036CACDB2
MGLEVRLTKKIMLTIAILLIISRALTLFTGYIGMNLFNHYNNMPTYERSEFDFLPAWKLQQPEALEETQLPTLTDFLKFDTYSYLRIATQGYDKVRIDEPHTAANWVFFPLYPLLIFITGKLLPFLEPIAVGMLLSNLFLYAALLFIYLIGRQRGLTEQQAGAVVFLVLLYPSSVYLSVAYTESLFLMLSAISIYCATSRQYALAFLAAGLSTVTRVPGVMNLAFVAGAVCLDQGFRFTRTYVKCAAYGVLSLVPMGLYLLHMYQITGDFLAPFHEQSLNWFRHTTAPFKNYIGYLSNPYFATPDGWDNGFIAFAVSTLVFLVYIAYFVVHFKTICRDWKQLLLYLYGAMLIVIPFSSQPYFLVSVVRYMMVCIPFYIYLVSLTSKSENGFRLFQLFFMIVNVIITIGFFNGYYFVI